MDKFDSHIQMFWYGTKVQRLARPGFTLQHRCCLITDEILDSCVLCINQKISRCGVIITYVATNADEHTAVFYAARDRFGIRVQPSFPNWLSQISEPDGGHRYSTLWLVVAYCVPVKHSSFQNEKIGSLKI